MLVEWPWCPKMQIYSTTFSTIIKAGQYIYILYNVCVSSNSVSPYKVISLYLSYFRGCELRKRLIDQALKGSEVNNSATLGLQDDGPRSNGGEMWGYPPVINCGSWKCPNNGGFSNGTSTTNGGFFFLPPLIAGASPIVLRGKAEFQHISK